MNSLVKTAWFVLLTVLFVGTDIFWIVGGAAIVAVLIWIFKPEWLDKHPKP